MSSDFRTDDIQQWLNSAVAGSDSYEALIENLTTRTRTRTRSRTDELVDQTIGLARGWDSTRMDIRQLEKVWQELEGYREPGAPQEGLVEFRGSLGFLIGTLYLFDNDRDNAQKFYRDPDTNHFISYKYGVPSEALENLSPFKFGTTSIIFRCGSNSDRVLKILRLQHVDDLHLTQPFTDYREVFGTAPTAPRIYDCGERWILMEYIEGQTLREFIDGSMDFRIRQFSSGDRLRGFRRRARSEYFDTMRKLFSSFLAVLEDLDAVGLSHYDLSPKNIIVAGDGARVRLIDFGVNHLLTRNVGKARELSEAQTYASPEILDGKAVPVLSDIYSFGMILLECSIGCRTSAEDLQGHLDDVWMRTPDLAMIIDDCLTAAPQLRALEYRTRQGTSDSVSGVDSVGRGIYSVLKARLMEALSNAELHANRPVLGEVLNFSVNTGNYFRDVAERMTERPDEDSQEALWKTQDGKLEAWKKVSICAVSTCVAIVPYLILFKDLDTWKIVEQLRLFLNLDSVSLVPSLPGRAVCCSFAVTAAVYYANIFQSVDIYNEAEEDPRKNGTYRIAKFWLRFNSFCFALPILWALILDPAAWPYCSALGLFFVGMNNYWIKRAARLARQSLDESFRVRRSLSVNAAMGIFANWDRLVFYYAVGLVGIGMFLWYQRALAGAESYPVECAFAVTVILINYFKMQKVNCTDQAPEVKKMLMHIFLSHKRLGDARLTVFDDLVMRLRLVSEWLQSPKREVEVGAVLILADERRDLAAYVEAIRKEGVRVTWCGDSVPDVETGMIHPTTIVVSGSQRITGGPQ